MPSNLEVIGGQFDVYVPDDEQAITLGWTHVRIFWASNETANAALVSTQELVAGQHDYSYNKTDAAATDWAEWCYYNEDTDTEGPRSERVPIGPPQISRKRIRQGVGRRLGMCRVLTVLDAPAPTATAFAAQELIDADASSSLYCNQFVRFTVGAEVGNSRRVRDVGTGYAPSTGVLTVNAFETGPGDGDEFELWIPARGQDPSVLVDEAINTVAHRIWWEDTHYLATDSGIAEYVLPQIIRAETVKGVRWAAGSYPERPYWAEVPHAHFRRDGGNLVLSLGGVYRETFGQGTIVQVEYSRPGDVLDSDDDAWEVPLAWAVAEVAMEFLDLLGTPRGGLENVIDAERAKNNLQRDLDLFRNLYMPTPRVRIELPR